MDRLTVGKAFTLKLAIPEVIVVHNPITLTLYVVPAIAIVTFGTVRLGLAEVDPIATQVDVAGFHTSH